MKQDKWGMFKNYMHNELGVSRDDIRTWIKEATREEAERVIRQDYGKFSVRDLTKEIIKEIIQEPEWRGRGLKQMIREDTAKILADMLILNIKEPPNESEQD